MNDFDKQAEEHAQAVMDRVAKADKRKQRDESKASKKRIAKPKAKEAWHALC